MSSIFRDLYSLNETINQRFLSLSFALPCWTHDNIRLSATILALQRLKIKNIKL